MALDSINVQYNNVPLPYISVTTGMDLQTILQNINTAVNTMSPAPNYSSYNLACVKETDGITHPTNTQNFAEGISKMLCDLITSYNTFTGTTYVANQAVIASAITGLQSPALTYSPFSITNTDTVTQVWTKVFTGFTSILAALNPSGGTWSTLSIVPPTTVTTGFNSLIAYLSTLTTTVNGKQSTLGTYNNTGNCLAGGASDSISTTVSEIITYLCSLPSFDKDAITWGCVPSETTLQDTIQSIISTLTSQVNNTVVANGTGLTIATVGSCLGKSLAIDPTYTQLYKVMVSGDNYSSANVLDLKVKSSDGSITTAVSGNKLDLTVTNPANGKVKVDSSDTTADYLVNKITSVMGSWGIDLTIAANNTDSKLVLTPTLSDPVLFIETFLTYIASNPDLLALWCSLQLQCNTCLCTAPSNLVVTHTTGPLVFHLAWTIGGTPLSQTAKYRQRGSTSWITTINFSVPNPLANIVTADTATSLAVDTVYQFQVDSVCSGATNGSNIYEHIFYDCQVLTPTVVSTIICVNQNPVPTISTIEYRLKNGGGTVVQTGTATGTAPNFCFTAVTAGTYTVEWRYGTMVNGVMLYSDDVSQIGEWCSHNNIVVGG